MTNVGKYTFVTMQVFTYLVLMQECTMGPNNTMKLYIYHCKTFFSLSSRTKNEQQKTKQVTTPLPRAARSFFGAKKMKKKIASLDFGDNPIYSI